MSDDITNLAEKLTLESYESQKKAWDRLHQKLNELHQHVYDAQLNQEKSEYQHESSRQKYERLFIPTEWIHHYSLQNCCIHPACIPRHFQPDSKRTYKRLLGSDIVICDEHLENIKYYGSALWLKRMLQVFFDDDD